SENIGSIRESFFVSLMKINSSIKYAKVGDFMVNDKYLFEIGGKNKNFLQIKDIKDSFLALDDIEIGFKNKIPLWLFGFLY
ncbi:MAG: ATP-binding protein, partial [Campylobacteraceae bacterium]|nr:ATP-binding protein [Campylobacteraceae bacterium]